MADPIPAPHSLGTKALDLAESGAKGVGNMAKAVAKSVVDDGANLVGKNVALGTRAEAGLNIAADVSSFVVGPEDAAGERAAVFAAKEGVAHAPHAARATEIAVRSAVERAPEVEHVALSAFEKTKALLEKAGHEFEDVVAHKGILETKNAMYKVLEEGVTDLDKVYIAVGKAGMDALEKGKNFAVHAEKAEDAVLHEIKSLRHESLFEAKGFKTALSSTEMKLEKAIETVEHRSMLERAGHQVSNATERTKNVIEPFEVVKKALEVEKHVVEFAVKHPITSSIVGSTALYAEQKAHDLGHAAIAAEHHLAADVKSIGNDVKSWTPDMSFENFGALLNHIRGASPEAPDNSPDIHHDRGASNSTPSQKHVDLGNAH